MLQKPRAPHEVYNDLNGSLINLFRILQRPAAAKKLIYLIRLTPFSRAEFELAYKPALNDIERARRFLILSHFSYSPTAASNGDKCGFKSSGRIDRHQPEAHDWAGYPDALLQVINRFSKVVIENLPALELLRRNDTSETLHYVDPPYIHASRRPKEIKNYGELEMTDVDHLALIKTLCSLKGMVVLSGYPSEIYDKKLYPHWHRFSKTHYGLMAKKTTEVLWLNDAAFRNCGRLF